MYARPISDLIHLLTKLPTIGPKTAQRLAFYMINTPKEEIEELAAAMITLKEKMRECEICHNLSEREKCVICEDNTRDESILCVVCTPQELAAIEKSMIFKGKYHVLGGALSPLEGIGPEKLNIGSLSARAKKGDIKEIILATSPTLAGEATALYLVKQLAGIPVKVTRPALGLPMGADLEYADEITLARAMEGRRNIGEG